ncbi:MULTISPECIES: TetR/AcrR family transcriptional regulator [Pantoea]|nr:MULTISPECIES: TetR/AcrR family transcriptional regulator [Pantoea]KKD34355.1 TetR family transcriptional regulator [Pantoea sp. 3.5.1]MBS6034628.1 TetR/AcrR family transcriptional regulator [Pantoea sp.]MBZ6393440.1 TetR/AcrR family transcriptional regulator [Pantoea sp.]MBZ6437577.1 TetR/AcrR family transcriptional regulator [Pantoea sp.]MCQ5470155.1 TetR/AcrR family transcriptional regulator [Pantoea brenneri]
MNKTQQRNETREHLLRIGEQICLQRGFTGMGLSELLTQAEVPKGSFYYYFRSKETFGVALLERYFARFLQDVELQLNQPDGTPRERLLNHFRAAEQLFTQQGHIVGCLGVKVSAEVCDLSEPMRDALQQGAAKITALYARTLSAAAQQESLSLPHPPEQMAELLSLLWLGASLQSKISREPQPLRLALRTIEQWLKIH